MFAGAFQVSVETKTALLNVLFAYLEACPTQYLALLFNDFALAPLVIPLDDDTAVLKCFTIATWIRLNGALAPDSETDTFLPLTLFLLVNSADHEPLIVQIQLWHDKFFVNTINRGNGSKCRFMFNHVLKLRLQRQEFTHFVLTYDKYQNLNLYIDGDYSESIPCPVISKADTRWIKLYVGDPLDPLERDNGGMNLFSKQELLINNLVVLDIACTFEWVSLLFFLGIGYDWSQKEFLEHNITGFLDHLSKQNYVLMSYRVADILSSRGQQVPYRMESHQRLALSKKKQVPVGILLPNKAQMVSLLAETKITTANFLLDITNPQFIEFIARANGQQIVHHQFNAFCSSLYCWGGSALLLSMMEAIMKADYTDLRHRDFLFFETLRLLLLCLEKDVQLSQEFETSDGYWALALLIDCYKSNFNANLELKDWSEFQIPACPSRDELNPSLLGGSYFRMIIGFTSASDNSGPYISNPLAFQTLVLNFDIFSSTTGFSSLERHILDLTATEKHHFYNVKELSKMKVLKKLLQHIKSSIIEGTDMGKIKHLSQLLATMIKVEVSVESIKLVSNFVIFALYNEPFREESQLIGLEALVALTNTLCGSSSLVKLLKKFSRSISIHWILLLLNFEGENKHMSAKIVCCAIGLLSKFLRVLGPHMIKRFFQANRGLSVLSYFLQNWWNNDSVVSVLFMNSFGVDNDNYGSELDSLPDLIRNKKLTHTTRATLIPDYINLLNKLVLTGLIQLGQKQGKVLSTPSSPLRSFLTGTSINDQVSELYLDVMHLINQIADMIETGFSESVALQAIFVTKDWLEGAFEIVAHLKVLGESSHPTTQIKIDFEACLTRYVSVLSAIFVSMLLDVKKLLSIMKLLSDITKKLIIDIIFPNIFGHINGFLFNSNFIFKELEFIKGATEILNIYHHDFVLQNYFISRENLDAYLTCLVAVIETSDTQSCVMHQLGPILGHALIMRLSTISHTTSDTDEFDEELENDFSEDLDENVKFCLNKQLLILDLLVLNDTNLRLTIELIMGNFLKLSPQKQYELSEHVLNFLRSAIVMRENDFSQIMIQMTHVSDYQNSSGILSEFFSFLATHNDEETVKYIQKFPTTKHIFNKNFHFRLSKLRDIGHVSVLDMMQVVINSGGNLGNTNSAQLQSFERDCKNLKLGTITQELIKYNWDLQDTHENFQFRSTSYIALKADVHRLLQESPITKTDFTLDYIEGANRMRMLLVSEDQMPESEKLSYSVKVPRKTLDTAEIQNAASLSLESVFSAFGIQDSLFLDPSSLEVDWNEYEEIDENGESSCSIKTSNEDRNRKVLRSLYFGDQIQALFNVSKVGGLDAVESLMILGNSHLYFIENFFHCDDGNVVDINEVPHEWRDPYLQFIKPQATENQGNRGYRTKIWSLKSFACVCKRKFLLRDIALELFFDDGASLLITCLSTKQRDAIHGRLSPYSSGESLDKDLRVTLEVSSSYSLQLSQSTQSTGYYLRSRLASAFSAGFTGSLSFSEITKKWKMGMMSNFYYLLSINTMAGRTFNDLTQYPIFPWVIADYESSELDFSNPETFRDLSKPMGAQSSKRAEEYRERFDALASMDDGNAPPFHYGTHYSSAMIVTSYLIRLKPYVHSYLLLQGGKFDHADRLFNSVGKAWTSASKENTTDVRELTPEFFYLPEFLENRNHFEFGELHDGNISNDVVLPKWAKGDPKIFIAKNREALESAHVSANLHHWIDLIFGFKQSGEEAIKALNVFHHLSYDGAINLDTIKDETEKRAVIGMINNFGQTPVKLFSKPHPMKEILNMPYVLLSFAETNRKSPVCTFDCGSSFPIGKLEIGSKSKKWVGRPPHTSFEDQILIKKPSLGPHDVASGSLFIKSTLFMNLYLSNISSLVQIENKFFITGSNDGMIHIWNCSLHPTLSVKIHSVLRGHLSAIRSLCYSKAFKICLSLDAEGGIIQWDITRFKFVRRIRNSLPLENSKLLMAISNDTGNFCTVNSTKYNNILTLYTLNGDEIAQASLRPGHITAVSIAQANDSLVELLKTDYQHSYWKDEYVVLSYSSPQVSLHIYKLQVNTSGWALVLVQEADIKNFIGGHVTSLQVYKQTEVCEEDSLSRGRLLFVIGDFKGRVYVW
ncbi:beach-domain-containing protein [Metschnikowia bicuspidata var. bicuspidata NRRL YB-4993]|uniref:Beige protein homolog 1 n=1 Tax=Metschnikowia bicuspidata var. bicuspidata NRRL YB-4993 TaxID=869754 RepID=A0A1A0HCJ9_9ASCO|nr:beach-domain-containing protein [Metschnikowia bicuspidata var. bicuspidata NRRL YB-4993]OBA21617.1 beach-domain-containing protein [Metschnikowia bicuspidata var. bicuspidata NRRL YB-4993]